MNKHIIQSLEKERRYLLTQWARANEEERSKILLKIMDIDERLEYVNSESQETQYAY